MSVNYRSKQMLLNVVDFLVFSIVKRVLRFWMVKNPCYFFVVILNLPPRFGLMRKHESSIPCDTDLSATNQKALFELRTEKKMGKCDVVGLICFYVSISFSPLITFTTGGQVYSIPKIFS